MATQSTEDIKHAAIVTAFNSVRIKAAAAGPVQEISGAGQMVDAPR